MEETVVNSSDTNKINQPAVGEWKNDENISHNDNYEQKIVETLNDTTLNDNSVPENVVIETQENNCGFSNENTQNPWITETEPKNHYGNKNNSGYRKGTGGYNKSNNGNNSYEKSYGNDSTSNNFSNNGHVRGRGRGRGRGAIKRYDEENESFRDECGPGINNHGSNTAPGHRGRGRGFNRGRGGRRDQSGSGGWYGNSEDGHKKNENDKSKAPYIPPDIENEESIAGIEAGLNFDKYNTIEVKVSGTNPPKSITSFHSSGLRTILLDNLSYCNFSTPTPIQNYAIPIIIDGRDLMASAQTGSGKTVS